MSGHDGGLDSRSRRGGEERSDAREDQKQKERERGSGLGPERSTRNSRRGSESLQWSDRETEGRGFRV